MLLSFVIPVLNEAESLPQLYKEIIDNVQGNSLEIIFIDDGSTDDSFKVMNQLALSDSRVKIIKFRKNFGKAAALQKGFDHAVGDIVFTMDADLQDNPTEISSFLNKLDEGYDIVSGWKQKRQDPLHKVIPSKIFNYVTAQTFNMDLRDFNCGFKAYRKALVKELSIYGEMHRYIPALANALGYKVGELPVQHRARIHGNSKYGWERYLRGMFDLMTVKMVTQYVTRPLYLFGRIGISSAFLGMVITIYLTIMNLLAGMPLSNKIGRANV